MIVEINLSFLKQGDPVNVKIIHKDDCKPKILNPMVIRTLSDFHFVYHENYKEHLINEGMNPDRIHVVGNTICEVVEPFAHDLLSQTKEMSYILADVHRPENFNSKERLTNIILYLNMLISKFNVPVKLLYFPKLNQHYYLINIQELQ